MVSVYDSYLKMKKFLKRLDLLERICKIDCVTKSEFKVNKLKCFFNQ